MLRTKLQGHQSTGSGVEDFKGFYHIWVWWPYWSGDLYGLNIFSFHQPEVALNGIWLQLVQLLLRRCLKLSYYESPGSKVKQ